MTCQYDQFVWLNWKTNSAPYYCVSPEFRDDGIFVEIRSTTHNALVSYNSNYPEMKQLAVQLLRELESKNIAALCTDDRPKDDTSSCPSDFPYLRSDGLCYQCPSDFPYLYSDDLCYDGPECTGEFPFLHSDNKCWSQPECNDPKFPYSHSDGLCHTLVECSNPEFPYPTSDGKCSTVVECSNPEFPYPTSDGKCSTLVECNDPEFPYPHSDGKCSTLVECNDPEFPYPRSDGKCWDVPEECGDEYPYRHSDGSCWNVREKTIIFDPNVIDKFQLIESIESIETVIFDPNVIDKFQLTERINFPPLPTVGKGSSDNVRILRLTDPLTSPDEPYSARESVSGSTLNVGDIIYVPPNEPPFIIDWGYATTTVKPGSIFLIGNAVDLQTFAKGNPHYIELVNGQLRLYETLSKTVGLSEKVCFNLKTAINLNRACGTDVTFTHDQTTGASSIQIDDGTVQVYDVVTDSIKEYGAGITLVTNNDGYYQVGQPGTPSSGGGCLIATATFGSELSPQVQMLREIRDNSLLNTESGSAFMESFNDFYYSFSPIIADYERENPVFKEMVKIAITPMISSLSILNYVDMDSEAEVLGYGISLILLNVGMYVGIPAIVIVGIRKRV